MQQSENRFFIYVWRFNALAIAAVTAICIVLGLYFGWTLIEQEARSRRSADVVGVGRQENPSEELSLGNPGAIEGTSYVQVALFRGQFYRGSSFSSTSGPQDRWVNLLFLNVSTNESRWLFNGVGQQLRKSEVLFNKLKEAPDQPRAAVAMVYVVIEKDTDGDNQLTERDAVSIATSAVDGTGYRQLIEGIDHLYSVRQVADDKVLVLYRKNRETRSELYSVPSMAPLRQASVPKVNLN